MLPPTYVRPCYHPNTMSPTYGRCLNLPHPDHAPHLTLVRSGGITEDDSAAQRGIVNEDLTV